MQVAMATFTKANPDQNDNTHDCSFALFTELSNGTPDSFWEFVVPCAPPTPTTGAKVVINARADSDLNKPRGV